MSGGQLEHGASKQVISPIRPSSQTLPHTNSSVPSLQSGQLQREEQLSQENVQTPLREAPVILQSGILSAGFLPPPPPSFSSAFSYRRPGQRVLCIAGGVQVPASSAARGEGIIVEE